MWPHPKYAEACATGEWANTSPKLIGIDEWIEKWLPGLERDNRSIAVFATPKLNAMVVNHSDMKNDLDEELSNYE